MNALLVTGDGVSIIEVGLHAPSRLKVYFSMEHEQDAPTKIECSAQRAPDHQDCPIYEELCQE